MWLRATHMLSSSGFSTKWAPSCRPSELSRRHKAGIPIGNAQTGRGRRQKRQGPKPYGFRRTWSQPQVGDHQPCPDTAAQKPQPRFLRGPRFPLQGQTLSEEASVEGGWQW
jgi:hypothetical protein